MDYSKAIIILLLSLFYLPVFSALTSSWQINPYYSHGFLVPAISAYFIWKKKNLLKYADQDFGYGTKILAAGLALYGIGILYKSLFLTGLSFIITLSGLITCFYGKPVLRKLMFPIGFLLFMIPLPFIDYLSFYMQSLTAFCSATILQTVGIPVTTTASQIRLENMFFVIGEPCSGMRTLISLLAVSAVYIYLIEGSLGKKLILFLSVFPAAAAANILRVSSILVIANYYGRDAAMTLFHDFSSLILFLLAFMFLILFSRCIGCSNPRNI